MEPRLNVKPATLRLAPADRLPPQNLEAEKSLLGSILLSNKAMPEALDLVQPEDFYRTSHGIIFAAMRELFERREPIDLTTLSNALQVQGKLDQVGGWDYLVELTLAVPTAANARYYAEIVSEKAVLRQIIDTTTELASRAYEGAERPDDLLNAAQRQILLLSRNAQREMTRIEGVLPAAMKHLTALFESEGQVTGIPTGFSRLDRLTSGLQPGNLIIIAARPGVGKTSLVLNMAAHAAIHYNKAVAFFSLEMSKEELVTRMLCSQALINLSDLRSGKLPSSAWEKLTKAATVLSSAPLYFDDAGKMDLRYIQAKCRRQHLEGVLDLVVVDYLQLMSGGGRAERREQEIAEISRGLKGLAKDLKVPVIALSQLNRSLEKRDDKRPQMSDLRESGSIEQDADLICFIHRPEVYNRQKGEETPAAPKPEVEKVELIVAKHRNGETDKIPLTFQGKYTRFADYAEPDAFGGAPIWE